MKNLIKFIKAISIFPPPEPDTLYKEYCSEVVEILESLPQAENGSVVFLNSWIVYQKHPDFDVKVGFVSEIMGREDPRKKSDKDFRAVLCWEHDIVIEPCIKSVHKTEEDANAARDKIAK